MGRRKSPALPPALLLTCEHASHHIPDRYQSLFAQQTSVLKSHRGWDPGTFELGKALACKFDAPLFATSVSRLLVEVNRSPRHPRLFSEFTSGLSADEKQELMAAFYFPHRLAIENWIAEQITDLQSVLHISLHSFTPILNGQIRNADIGLLYDPQRPAELALCDQWHAAWKELQPEVRVRRNYPYRGTDDGFTTYLRRRFPDPLYAGIELEVNQQHILPPAKDFKVWIKTITLTLERALGNPAHSRPHRAAT